MSMVEKMAAQHEEDTSYDPVFNEINVKHFEDKGANYLLLVSQELLLGVATDPVTHQTMFGTNLGIEMGTHAKGCQQPTLVKQQST